VHCVTLRNPYQLMEMLQHHCRCVSEPDVPTKPEVSDIKQTSVKLSWQPGESRVINETSIVYQKKSEDQNSQTITLSLSSANVDRARRSAAEPAPAVFLLSGLEPASVYVIHVVVQSFDKTSRSLVTEFETRQLSFICVFRCCRHKIFLA